MQSSPASRPATPLSLAAMPTGLRARRGSLASVTSRSNIDKEVVSHVLDEIHSSASQSAALTTFNDFGPPPAASAHEDRSSASQLVQQGIGNLYARFRGAKSSHSREASDASAQSPVSGDRVPREHSSLRPGPDNRAERRSRGASTTSLRSSEIGTSSQALDDKASGSSRSAMTRDEDPQRPKAESNQLTSSRKSREKLESEDTYPTSRASVISKSSSVATNGHQRKPASGDVRDAIVPKADDAAFLLDVELSPLASAETDGRKSRKADSDAALARPDFLPSPRVTARADDAVRGHDDTMTEAALLPLSSIQSASVASSASGMQSPAMSSLSEHASNSGMRPGEPQRLQSQSSVLLHEMRRKVLSRDFWMKDENAKVCFRCGDQFSTFRRKHHCRTCGQIYDAKCTVLTSGKPFGQASKLRVCKTCETILNGDDSSDYSEDDTASIHQVKQIRFSDGPEHIRPSTPASSSTLGGLKKMQDLRRRPGSSEFAPALARPSSSRSLKSLSSRPRSSSHRHRRIMQQHLRTLGVVPDSGMPFQPSGTGSNALQSIHADSIIDPELAPYMSEEGSSDDEMPSIGAQLSSSAQDNSSGGLASLVGSARRAKHKPSRSVLDVSQVGRDADGSSLTSARLGQMRRQMGVRTLSSGSLIGLHGTSPRVIRSQNLMADYGSHVSMLRRASIPDADGLQSSAVQGDPDLDNQSRRVIPAAELNSASLDHVKLLLRQFLTDSKVGNAKRWEKVLIPILLRCAEEVDPNINRGDDIDIRHYVKLKKAPGGNPKDSAYVSGVIFTKNLALRGMPRVINNPRILLVSFPIIYDRHQQHFMSLEPVIAQEREYLRNLTNRIKALRPSVVLVQRQVAGLAVEFLNEAHIAVASNVKESVLQAISRCTETHIISSVDRLTMDPDRLGRCQKFEVRTFLEQDVKKSYVFVAGCQRDLGCTILLRGADKKTLRSLKWITEFMCFAVYNLKLETCLMRDECVTTPSKGFVDQLTQAQSTPDQDVDKAFCETLFSELRTRILSVSPFVKLDEPWLLLRGREQEQVLQRLKTLLMEKPEAEAAESEDSAPKFEMIKHEMLFGATTGTSPQLQAAIRAIHEAEYDRAAHHYQALKRRWEAYVAGAVEPFNPLSHQQIVVLFSIVSTPSGDACEGPDLLGLDFYQEHDIENSLEPDVPLGEYIERLCHQASFPCSAQRCDRTMLDHSRQYVHGDGQLSISIHTQTSKIRGMENTILMWSICRQCDEETQVVPMSRDTWKYSFGKYLELSFWNQPMHTRTGSCPHDIHKSHTRYFGFKGMAVCVRYEPINIMEILVPRSTVAWKVDKDISLKNDQYERIESRTARFLASVKARIRSIKIESVDIEKAEDCKGEIADMIKRVGEEQDFLREKLREKYMTSKHYEIIPMNRAVRALQEKVADWDATFADFERNYFPSETDIRKLAAQQLRKVYLDAQGEDSADNNEDSDEVPDEDEARGGMNAEKDPARQHLETKDTLPVDNALSEAAIPAALEHQVAHDVLHHDTQQKRDLDTVQRLDLAVPQEAMDQLANSPADNAVQTPSRTGDLSGSGGLGDLIRVHNPTSESSSPSQRRRQLATEGRETAGSSGTIVSPPLLRSQTSPSNQTTRLQRGNNVPEAPAISSAEDGSAKLRGAATNFGLDKQRTSGRLAMAAALRTGKSAMQSMIPRSIPSQNNYTKVSALAKHFEQMSREFEKERLRERKQRAARNRQARVYPMASYRPIVEVFRDASEAVRERDATLEDHLSDLEGTHTTNNADEKSESASPEASMRNSLDRANDADHSAEGTLAPSYEVSEIDQAASEPEPSISGGTLLEGKSEQDDLSLAENMELPIDLPKHDRSSLMKMLTSFWSERSASGWNALDYPLSASDHIFADSDILVREDEPSSLIAFALASQDYSTKLHRFRERARDHETQRRQSSGLGAPIDGKDLDVERTLLGKTATHMKYQFQAESARMQCKIFYAESFDAIRRKCGIEERFVESLSRCAKWDSKGGKSKSIFLKTLDERFVIKSLSPVETQAFLKFAPDYFDFMSKCLFHNLPSCLAKMLGCYQVVIKNPLTGIEFSYFLQVMENVFYENPSNRLFDLKGSMRNRRIESTGEKDEVLLDENMLDYISQSPIYVRNHSNSLLASSITNDTLFCSKQNVMDYSLIVGLYDDRKELMVGIIDYIRTYTWDKKLESWIKDRGKHKPTVRSPREYRNRFRASIPKYFPLAPSSWQVFGRSQTVLAPTPMSLLADQEHGHETLADSQADDGDGEDDDGSDSDTA